MFRILLLFFALFVVSGTGPASAARPSAYARAKMSGRTYTHRPNYKLYKGRRGGRGLFQFGRSKSHSKIKHRPTRSSRI